MKLRSLDIFCEIIDNFGDIGVVYRLGKEFRKVFGEDLQIRVVLNRLDEFNMLHMSMLRKICVLFLLQML